MEIVLFDKSVHVRSNFDCGEVQINSYLKTRLSQDIKLNACRCYVLKEIAANDIIGFITLSASSIQRENIDDIPQNKLPRYTKLPSLLIGRMGVDKKHQGKQYGDLLVYKAFEVASNLPIGISLVEVEAKNKDLTKYYQRLGFIHLQTTNKHNVLIKKV